jgi:hypothetical protein
MGKPLMSILANLIARERSDRSRPARNYDAVVTVSEPNEEPETATAQAAGRIGPQTIIVVVKKFAEEWRLSETNQHAQ